jgi:hypothetical protein
MNKPQFQIGQAVVMFGNYPGTVDNVEVAMKPHGKRLVKEWLYRVAEAGGKTYMCDVKQRDLRAAPDPLADPLADTCALFGDGRSTPGPYDKGVSKGGMRYSPKTFMSTLEVI